MNQALYPVDKIEWCVYALYKEDTERIGTYCTIVTTYRHANMAQSLDGYLWAVSSLKKISNVSPHEDDTALQALTNKSNFTYFKPTQHFRIHWICL